MTVNQRCDRTIYLDLNAIILSFFFQVNDKTYSSYPNDFKDESLAKQYTAKLALDELIKESSKQQYHLLSTENDILLRIPPILEKHFHGIWSWQLEADYIDRFHEQLPKNWLEIVDISPCISVERCLDDKYVLRFCKPEEVIYFINFLLMHIFHMQRWLICLEAILIELGMGH